MQSEWETSLLVPPRFFERLVGKFMRLWSIHPKSLDTKGLVALWREALLAQKVLQGETVGYKNHPQLIRFKNSDNPLLSIGVYLQVVWIEANSRGFNFNREKINTHIKGEIPILLDVTDGQLEYERSHLLNKLKSRDKERYKSLYNQEHLEQHSMFKIVDGEIEEWEIVDKSFT